MKLDCPHCGTSFEAADDRDPTADVTCPNCMQSFSVAEAGSSSGDDGDFGFELDDLMSYSGIGTVASLDLEATATSAPESFEARDTKGSPEPDSQTFETSFDEAVAEMSAIGFDEADPERTGDVSHLRDVDLTMIGTYHRTGRKLHHATDVVWTGKGESEEVQTPPPTPTEAKPTPSAFEPISPSDSIIDDSFASSASFTASQSVDFEASLSMDAAEVDPGLTNTKTNVPEPESGPVEKLDEMDFSSLLEDSISGKSLFGQDSNPFVDVGIASDSVTGVSEYSALGSEQDDAPSDAHDSSPETKTFFVDAPSVEDEDQGTGVAGGALDAQAALDIDTGSHVGPLPGAPLGTDNAASVPAPKSAGARGRGTHEKRSSAPLIVFFVLVLIAGAGVGGEYTGNGWFFMNLIEEPAVPPARGEDPSLAQQASSEAKQAGAAAEANSESAESVGLADMPSAYRAKAAELESALKSAQAGGVKSTLTDELVVLYTKFLYRWPARMHHDDAMQQRLAELRAGRENQSFHAQFWEFFQSAIDETDAEKKTAGLKKAEIALAKVNFGGLSPESNLLYKALLFASTNQKSDALPLVELALNKNPQSQWAAYERARLLLESNKLDEAKAATDALLELNPQHPDAAVLQVNIAIARQTQEAYGAGIMIADALRGRMKESGDLYGEYQANLLRARLYGLQNDLKNRLASLEAASAYDPNNETLLLELADTDIRTGNSKKAAERLKQCDPKVCGSLRFFRTYIKTLQTDHLFAEAEAVAAKAEEAHPDSPDILFASGSVSEQRGKLRAAAKQYAKVLEKDPKHLEAYLRLAGIHRREKAYGKAIAVLDSASQVFEGAGKDSEAALALELERAELLVQRGRKDDARKIFSGIVQERPNNSHARLRLATLHVELGAAAKAVDEFEKILRQGKGGTDVSLPFAEALLQSGKPDRAIEELKSYLETSQNDLQGLVKLGHAYVMKQRYEEAMAVLEHAVAINRNFAPAYYYAGLAEFGRQRQRARDVERRLRNGEPIRMENKPDFGKAIRALNNAREKAPENLEYRRVLAEALTESGRQRDLQSALEQYDSIIREYRKSIRLGRPVVESAEVYFKRGLLASKLSRPRTEVVSNFKSAIVLDSGRADFVARYGEELYRNQTKKRIGDQYVLEAKSYFQLVMEQYDRNHVRSNYYMGKITLREWDKQSNRRPYDKLHKLATEYFQNVIRHNGALEFPETYFNLGNIMKDRQISGLANEMYSKYLETYKRSTGKQSPKERYVRDLMRKR